MHPLGKHGPTSDRWIVTYARGPGQTISIATSSRDYWDTIAVLFSPDGTPVVSSDDRNAYFAAFDWVAEEAATYLLQGDVLRKCQQR